MQLQHILLAPTVAAILSVVPSMAAADNCSASIMTDEEREAFQRGEFVPDGANDAADDDDDEESGE